MRARETSPFWSSRGAGLVAGGCIVLAALVAYCNSFSGPFVLDDPSSITDNPSIRHLWPPWMALSPPHGSGLTVEGRPLVNLSFALNYAISGPAVWSYHAFNLAVHLLAGLALFGIVRRTLLLSDCGIVPWNHRPEIDPPLTVPEATKANATWFALAGALLWILHPLQTAAVTYISQRAESLMGLFYLLTLFCFIRGAQASAASGRWWYTLSAVCCLAGMGTKEVMVTAPLIVLLFDRTFVAGGFRDALRRRKGFYTALAGTWILLLVLVASAGDRGGTIGSRAGVAWWEFALTQSRAIVRYLGLAVWPHPLIFDYGSDFVHDFAAIAPFALLDVALIAVIAIGLWRRKPVAFLGAWFFVLLAPSSSVVGGTRQMLAEHRMFLPLAGVIGALLVGAHTLLGRRAAWLGLGLAAALGGVTLLRNRDYRDELSLWSDTVAKRPANHWAHNNLGLALKSLGRVAEAEDQFRASVRLRADYSASHNNLGNLLLRQDRLPEAMTEFKEARRLAPDDADVPNNLGNASLRAGRLDEAIAEFGEALRLQPDHAEAHNNLGNALAQSGRLPEAMRHYEAALRAQPDYFEVYNNLGNALLGVSRLPEAIRNYETALRLQPGYAEAHYNLANALSQQDRLPEAVRHYEDALRLRPVYPSAQGNLANALLRLGRLPEAIARYEAALQLTPADPILHYNYANALFQAGRRAEAVAQCEMALRLKPGFPEARQVLERLRGIQ